MYARRIQKVGPSHGSPRGMRGCVCLDVASFQTTEAVEAAFFRSLQCRHLDELGREIFHHIRVLIHICGYFCQLYKNPF